MSCIQPIAIVSTSRITIVVCRLVLLFVTVAYISINSSSCRSIQLLQSLCSTSNDSDSGNTSIASFFSQQPQHYVGVDNIDDDDGDDENLLLSSSSSSSSSSTFRKERHSRIRKRRHLQFGDILQQVQEQKAKDNEMSKTQTDVPPAPTSNVMNPFLMDYRAKEKSTGNDTGRTLKTYHKITSGTNGALGIRNYNVTNGNPLKGLALNPANTPGFRERDNVTDHPFNGTKRIEHSLEAWYIGLDMVQTDYDAFNWTSFEERLNDTWSRGCHSIPRFMIDYPGEPLHLPPFLLKENIQLEEYSAFEYAPGISPVYSDPKLLRAIENFIKEFGRLYDDDQRIAFIQLGILGWWGEW